MALVTFVYTLNIDCTTTHQSYLSTVIYKASRKPLEAMTPRMVYKWFTVVYNVSFVVGLVGYIIILVAFFGIAELFNAGSEFIQIGILMLSYGLYFG